MVAATGRGTAAQEPEAVPDLSRWEDRLVHESWTTDDGLPVNSITWLLQTLDGYIWIGTFDGLVRFDGTHFTVFNSANVKNLPSNRIVQLFEGHDGALWFNTESGLVRFRNNRFEPIDAGRGLTGDFLGFYEDRSGRTWLATTEGLGQMRGDSFVVVLPEPIGRLVTKLIQRRDGNFWAATRGGGLFRLTGDPDGPGMDAIYVDALDSSFVGRLFEDRSGRLWIGSTRGIWVERDGLSRVASDRPLESVFQIVYSPQRDAIYAYAGSGIFRLEGRRAVVVDSSQRPALPGRPIAVDATGGLWYANGSALGHDGRSVLSLGPDAGQGSPPARITTMLVDREGSIWLGTQTAGLHRVKPSFMTTLSRPEGLSYQNIYPVFQAESGDVWIGTFGNGLNRIHRDGSITTYTAEEGYPSTVRTLISDRPDRLWIAAIGGLFRCSLPAMDCARDSSMPLVEPFAFFVDSADRLWAGYNAGLMRLEGDRWITIPDWPVMGQVRAFAETEDGALWLGTNGSGLVRYHNGAITRVTVDDGLPIDVIRALHVDGDGQLWVGTEGRGLARLDPMAWGEGEERGDRRIVSIRAADGLFDEVIHQILEDDAGRFWMSTNRGIFWVSRDALKAFADGRLDHVRSTSYTERDGMRNREANGGVQPAGMRARDGRLWFPTQDGVVVLDPDDVTTARVPPPVVVERVVTGDSTMFPEEGAIALGVDQRDIEIDYTALSFLEPDNIRFRYRLDPYDDDWVEAGSRRSAFYTRVPPGRYTFRVTASSDPGVWAGEEASADLVFEPRFRETRSALMLAIASLGLLVFAVYRRRVGNLRRRERELTLLVEERTADLRKNERQLEERNEELAAQTETLAELHEARSRLFANLSHELRTPLTLILGPLRSLLTGRHGALDPAVQNQHGLMLRNSERLLGMINQILDMSSLQAGALTLDSQTADLVDFARSTTAAFASLAEERGIELGFRSDVTELSCGFDREQLEKVLLNLLSNALKFTEHGGSVDVSVHAEDTAAVIVVKDTGVGIAPEELPRVFDRFYQGDTSTTRRYAGTGIGLALTRELVELHGGEIVAESTPGVGSTFTVRLPATAAAAVERGEGPSPIPEDAVAEAVPVETSRPTSAVLTQAIDEESAEDRTTILVVDDNDDVRAYVRSILEPSYSIIEARDGAEGLETARTALPDLIVADVMMPRVDGLALGRALKDDLMTDAIPLILLTARAAPEDHVAGLDTGCDAYLAKPFHPGVLEATVANLLAQRRLLRERFRQGEAVPPATPAPDTPTEIDTRLRPLVEAHLADPDFGPNELAAAAGLSYHQLYRALRDEIGFTPSAFIRRIRVECAAELLRQRAGSVTEIAYSVGFESLSYFRRAFHERFAASPTTWLASVS